MSAMPGSRQISFTPQQGRSPALAFDATQQVRCHQRDLHVMGAIPVLPEHDESV